MGRHLRPGGALREGEQGAAGREHAAESARWTARSPDRLTAVLGQDTALGCPLQQWSAAPQAALPAYTRCPSIITPSAHWPGLPAKQHVDGREQVEPGPGGRSPCGRALGQRPHWPVVSSVSMSLARDSESCVWPGPRAPPPRCGDCLLGGRSRGHRLKDVQEQALPALSHRPPACRPSPPCPGVPWPRHCPHSGPPGSWPLVPTFLPPALPHGRGAVGVKPTGFSPRGSSARDAPLGPPHRHRVHAPGQLLLAVVLTLVRGRGTPASPWRSAAAAPLIPSVTLRTSPAAGPVAPGHSRPACRGVCKQGGVSVHSGSLHVVGSLC